MKLVNVAAMLVFMVSTNFLHAETGVQEEIDFNSLDANDDGLISREEGASEERLVKYWGSLDSDRDGYLDEAERDNAMPIITEQESRLTDHPQKVQQYEDGRYQPPQKQKN